MNKRVLISAVSVLSIAMVIGIASVGNKVASSLNIVKADPVSVKHTITFDHNSTITHTTDGECDYIELIDYTEHSNEMKCDKDYSYVTNKGGVTYLGSDYIFEATNLYPDAGNKVVFNFVFYFELDIYEADKITGTASVSEKRYDAQQDTYYWKELDPVAASNDSYEELAEMSIYYGNATGAYAVRLNSITFNYTCSY